MLRMQATRTCCKMQLSNFRLANVPVNDVSVEGHACPSLAEEVAGTPGRWGIRMFSS